jgi:enoyl-CoA hydratase/carnithine racemase
MTTSPSPSAEQELDLPADIAEADNLRVTREGTVVRVMLNRPERLNALTWQLFAELKATIAFIQATPEIRVLVISGAGRGFCAGMDLSGELLAAETLQAEMIAQDSLREVLLELESLPVAKIAEISGPCAGGGLALALMCDLRYATAGTKFSVPELDLGYPYSMNGIPQLVRAVGTTLAADMIYTCRQVPALEAHTAGLITEVLETDEELTARVDEVVASLATRPALLIWGTAKALRQSEQALLPSGGTDLPLMMLASFDAECQQANADYQKRFRRGR